MKEERTEYIKCIQALEGDISSRKTALEKIKASDIYAHGRPIPFSFVPYLYNRKDMDYLRSVARTTCTILKKVIKRYLENKEYRKLFCFPAEIERLILLPCNYEQLLPIGRFDLFINEDDLSFKFCEFNADGSGGMSRDTTFCKVLSETESFKCFAQKHTSVKNFDLINSWADTFLRIYKSDPISKKYPTPTVAITDFEESGVKSDFDMFIEAFKKRGASARFVDVRKFVFDGEALYDPTDNTRIDAIYRRAVTSEILQHLDECSALIKAVEQEKVCLIGHFRTNIIHTKMINIALFDESRNEFLTDEEIAFIENHVCKTYHLENEKCDVESIKSNKDAWIIKPADDYGAHGVFPGVDFKQSEWERIVNEHLNKGYIIQEFYQPKTVDIVLPEIDENAAEGSNNQDNCKIESWQSMPGFYIYDCELAGFYCRLGQNGIIALGDAGGICAPVFGVDL